LYAGIISIDGGRLRYSVKEWKTLLALKALSTEIRSILSFIFRDPKKAILSPRQLEWLDLWQEVLSQPKLKREREKSWEKGGSKAKEGTLPRITMH
jgi:ATP-dependent RNA helicase DHX29